MTYIINTLILIFFNFINSRVDAYRILKHKNIAHGINFGLYAVLVGFLLHVHKDSVGQDILFSLSAFFNRQVVFDSFLNKRRGLSIFYMSTANPPKAIMDRIERKIFDYNGKLAFFTYLICFIICTIIYYII